MKQLFRNRLRFCDSCPPLSRDNQSDLPLSKRRILAEIVFVFAVFALQGSWPVPDVNEPYYLGKTIHYWNPNWVPGDCFLNSKDTHKVFYLVFGWLSLCLAPAALAWTGRIATWWLLAWSWRRMSFTLLPKPGWSILSAALFAMLMDRCHMAGEWVIGSVEAKDFAYVFVFLGLESLLKNHWNRAWLLFGAASAMHVLVGGWAAVAALLAWLLIGCARPGLRTMLPGLGGGFLLALPGLLPALFLNANVDSATIRQANQIYVFERLSHHLDVFQISPEFIYRFCLLTLLYLALSQRISSGMRGAEAAGRGLATGAIDDSAKSSIMRFHAFVAGAILIAMIGGAVNMLEFYDRDLAAGLLRYYWYRLPDVVVPLGVAMLGCRWIMDSRAQRSAMCSLAAVLTGLALVGHFGFIAMQRLLPDMPRADRLANPLEWREACLWAADERNTPPTARFITPRMAQTFKWYARRAEVANWKEVPQNAEEIVQWRERINDLFAADGADPERRWHDSLNELGALRIVELGRKYKADFLIAEAGDPPLDLKIVFHNKGYVIYELKNKKVD
jgi:hypothetical protein